MPRLMICRSSTFGLAVRTAAGIIFCFLVAMPTTAQAELRAGAAVVDVTPERLPVLVNGGMLTRSVGKVKTRVNAR